MSFKVFRYVSENILSMVCFFDTEQELLNFFNNSYELEQRTGIKTKEQFKTLEEIKVFVANHNSIIELKEQVQYEN